MLGGSPTKAEEHFRRALRYDPQNLVALSLFAELLASNQRPAQAQALLRRLLDAPFPTSGRPRIVISKRKPEHC